MWKPTQEHEYQTAKPRRRITNTGESLADLAHVAMLHRRQDCGIEIAGAADLNRWLGYG
jgi:hypothetical protein